MRIEYEGEEIILLDRASCPHCQSRRNVTFRQSYGEVTIWNCQCPTLKRLVRFATKP